MIHLLRCKLVHRAESLPSLLRVPTIVSTINLASPRVKRCLSRFLCKYVTQCVHYRLCLYLSNCLTQVSASLVVLVFNHFIDHRFALHLRQLISKCANRHHCYSWSHFVEQNLSFQLAQSVVKYSDLLRYCLSMCLLALSPPNQPVSSQVSACLSLLV